MLLEGLWSVTGFGTWAVVLEGLWFFFGFATWVVLEGLGWITGFAVWAVVLEGLGFVTGFGTWSGLVGSVGSGTQSCCLAVFIKQVVGVMVYFGWCTLLWNKAP